MRDENNRLKGEQGKPDIKANKKKGLKKDYSSEKERKLKLLPQETVLTQTQLNALLEQHLEKLSSGYRSRITEAAAIAFYHRQNNWPVLMTIPQNIYARVLIYSLQRVQ